MPPPFSSLLLVIMIEGDENSAIENKGNRDNACNTTCRVSGLGFRPGLVYVNQGEENEIIIVDEEGKQDSWFLDDALDSIPFDEERPKEVLPHSLASQDEVGDKVSCLAALPLLLLIFEVSCLLTVLCHCTHR